MKKVLIALLVVALLAVAGYVFAQSRAPVNQVPTLPEFIPTSDPSFYLDSDGDGMNDWFEANIAETNPKVYNARFVILVSVRITNTHEIIPLDDPYDQDLRQELREFFIEKEKIPAENVMLLVGNWEEGPGATLKNFNEAVSRVAQKSDAESLVYVFLWSHGGDGDFPAMDFADGQGYEYSEGVGYAEIGRKLNEIACKRMLVGVHSCALESALEPLAREATYPRAVVFGAREVIGAMGEDVRYYSISDVIYGNQDGYVSLEEVINFKFNEYYLRDDSLEESRRQAQVWYKDKSNIASKFYLGDYIPPRYAKNKAILTELKETGQYRGWYEHSGQLE